MLLKDEHTGVEKGSQEVEEGSQRESLEASRLATA